MQALEDLRKRGNDVYARKDYKGAVSFYSAVRVFVRRRHDTTPAHHGPPRSQGLSLDPKHATLLSNRSMAYLALKNHVLALQDGRTLAAIDPTSVKANLRIGDALLGLNRYGAAVEAFEKGLKQAPNASDRKTLEDKRTKALEAQTAAAVEGKDISEVRGSHL